MTTAVDTTSGEDGWSPLGSVGNYLANRNASFDPRNYGFSRLVVLARAQDYLEIDHAAATPRGAGQAEAGQEVRDPQADAAKKAETAAQSSG